MIINYVNGEESREYDNTIVILSDMIHESDRYDFSRLYTPAYLGKVLESLQAKGALPDLRASKVIVSGRTGKNAKQVEGLHYFWRQYFTLAGAQLVAYEYDATE